MGEMAMGCCFYSQEALAATDGNGDFDGIPAEGPVVLKQWTNAVGVDSSPSNKLLVERHRTHNSL